MNLFLFLPRDIILLQKAKDLPQSLDTNRMIVYYLCICNVLMNGLVSIFSEFLLFRKPATFLAWPAIGLGK